MLHQRQMLFNKDSCQKLLTALFGWSQLSVTSSICLAWLSKWKRRFCVPQAFSWADAMTEKFWGGERKDDMKKKNGSQKFPNNEISDYWLLIEQDLFEIKVRLVSFINHQLLHSSVFPSVTCLGNISVAKYLCSAIFWKEALQETNLSSIYIFLLLSAQRAANVWYK